MTIASHYVFMDLDELIKNERYVKLEDLSRKYCERYHKDEELKGVCESISNLVSSERYDELETLREELKELINTRKMQTSGGTRLWFKSRR